MQKLALRILSRFSRKSFIRSAWKNLNSLSEHDELAEALETLISMSHEALSSLAHIPYSHTSEVICQKLQEIITSINQETSYFHALLSQDNNKRLNSRLAKKISKRLKNNDNLDSDVSDNIMIMIDSAVSLCEPTMIQMIISMQLKEIHNSEFFHLCIEPPAVVPF
ncbi:24361_t:CDS:2 [Entrophospora sp. SA101]|nr:24361_t:CDS:2 [Entrophospora sp. SA101]